MNLLFFEAGWPSTHSEEEEEEDIDVSMSSDSPLTANRSSDGFWSTVMKGLFTIAVMGVNAFCAAVATQVYKIFTQRWREGGGSEIPVITTAPGSANSSGSSPSSSSSGSGYSTQSSASQDFLNRYRD
jgi:hypothetical protein